MICYKCGKVEKRIRNHLRQTHHVPLHELQEKVDKCTPVLDTIVDDDEEEESIESDIEEERREEVAMIRRLCQKDIDFRGAAMATPCSEDSEDEDWLAKQYFESVNMPRPIQSTKEPLEVDSERDSYESEDSECDEDDGATFFMSSVEEDQLLDGFSSWLCSMDGGSKKEEQARKHRTTLQAIVRFKGRRFIF